jgi:HlyD family secretion protein
MKFNFNIILYALAGLGVLSGIRMIIVDKKPLPNVGPIVAPSLSPYKNYIGASGILEPSSKSISVGSQVSGIVNKLNVEVGNQVKEGDILFSLEKNQILDEILVKQSLVEQAKAGFNQAKISLKDALDKLALIKNFMSDPILSKEEVLIRKNNVLLMEAALKTAEKNLKTTESQLKAIQTLLSLHDIKAPITGEILQINVKKGEYITQIASATPNILLGDTVHFHVRVDIDENEAWRFEEKQAAVAVVRGNPSLSIPLTYVYSEPYIIPKKNLTGESTERIDVRVFQVLYRFKPLKMVTKIGQQMDVYIEVSK